VVLERALAWTVKRAEIRMAGDEFVQRRADRTIR
jgi:hypothetical protein